MPDDVTPTVGGQSIAGWMTIRVSRGMERIPADFDIGLAERYPDTTDVSVMEGDPCILSIGGDSVITGYVDRVLEQIDAHNHVLTIAGRGKCEDLTDCSAQFDSFQFQQISTAEIAAMRRGGGRFRAGRERRARELYARYVATFQRLPRLSGRHGCDLTLMPPDAFRPEPILYMPLPQEAAPVLGMA